MQIPTSGTHLTPVRADPPGEESLRDRTLRGKARQLEAGFLTEMLKHAGVGETPEGFGGGIGEDQFAGLLREMQAQQMTEAGGIGLAETIFHALRARRDG